MAQMADNAVPESKNLPGSTATATEPEVPTNMVQASLNDPQATAEDLGLASPGTGISLPALNK